MTDHPESPGSDEHAAPDELRTGVASVDAVLAEVAGLQNCPVDEHVAVFERAHEQLRQALDARPAGPTPGQPGSAGRPGH